MVELRQHVGWYITFSKQDVLKDLGSAIPEAQGQDRGIPQVDPVAMTDVRTTQHSPTETPQVDDTIPLLPGHQSKAKIKDRGTLLADSTTSPAMANMEDIQPCPMEAPPTNEDTVPLAEFNAEAKQGLLATWAASPAESGNQVASSARSADKSAGHPPCLAI